MTEVSSQVSQPVQISVVVVTWCRPEHVRACLEHLGKLAPLPDEVVVIDASPDDRTASVVNHFPRAQHVSFPAGAGHMTTARNAGLLRVHGDIVAFVDDDANVHSGWSRALRDAFADPTVGAVAGRTLNGHHGEESEGVDAIGRVLPDGRLTGFFAADPGSVVEVDHGIGANMSFRRSVLAQLGGFRDDFRGVGGLREDTDVFLRVRALGHRVIFSPAVIVDHVGAPHVRGRRFDYRYAFWARRNHALLLARNCGVGSQQFRRWVAGELRRTALTPHRSLLRRVAHAAIGFAGVVAGVLAGLRRGGRTAVDPIRRDGTGETISRHLSQARSRGHPS